MEGMYDKINRLKKEKNAVVLAHYYAPAGVQRAADYIGDSYFLAKKARGTSADIIVFCGVAFMGESAKILNPEKTVLMPAPAADCPMAHMADEEKIREVRSMYPDAAVACYINSTARLKMLSDVCVTSANAVKIVRRLPNKNVFFIPDKNLGAYVKEQVPEKNIILNDGFCPIHDSLALKTLERCIKEHPGAEVLVHPECRREILDNADFIGSTSGIIAYAEKSDAAEFIVCTEEGVGFELGEKCPDKKFYFAGDELICADMKMNTPEALADCLENGSGEVVVDDDIRRAAIKPLNRMLELAD